jgi:hypothetical protein
VDEQVRTDEATFSRQDPGVGFWMLGFLAALRRYRRVTMIGWLIAAGGALSLLLRWRAEGVPGLIDVLLSSAMVAGGVLLVHYGIEGLTAFIRTALSAMHPEAPDELRSLMEDVDQGGWQEAFAALRRLRRLAEEQKASHG